MGAATFFAALGAAGAVTSAFHFITGKDLGPQYVNSIYALYAFLGGHALGQMKWGNSSGDDAATAADPAKGQNSCLSVPP